MKKILFIIFIIFAILIIYLTTLDKKIYYLALGDGVALGITDNGIIEKNYSYYVKKYLEENEKLERYVNHYTKEGKRLTDIINDIKNNKVVNINNKKYTLKNALIKSDLVTISINNKEIFSYFNNSYYHKDLYNWIDELSNEYEKMLNLIRDYCKEKVIVIGYYYPNNGNTNKEINDTLLYLNDSFKKISENYNIKYIIPFSSSLEISNYIGEYYPTEQGYKKIGEQIILEINK